MRKIDVLKLFSLLCLSAAVAWAASGGISISPMTYLVAADSIEYYYLTVDDDYANVTLMFSISSISTGDTCWITLEQSGWGTAYTTEDYWITTDTLNSDASLGSNTTFPYKEKVTLTNKLSGVRIKVEWGVLGSSYPWAMTWGYQYVFHGKY